jgi:hypothetical protein
MKFGSIRSVDGDVILSPSLPRIAVRFSSDFIYLGDLQYIARGVHHVEEFLFLQPNGLGHATRLLLVHFEGFLENKEGSYEFPEQPAVELDGETYQYERYWINIQDDLRRFPGSDLAHAADYIRQRAYTLAGDMIFQRFSRIITPDHRHLFSITCMEVDDLARQADPSNLDEAVHLALLERATSSFSFVMVE